MRHGIAWVLAGLILVIGCRAERPRTVVADDQTLQNLRDSYQKVTPGAQVGRVTAVLPDASLAAIGDLPVQEFRNGDVLTFIDQQQNVIAVGRVVTTTPTSVHVKYEFDAKTKLQRAPQEGDLAVRVPE